MYSWEKSLSEDRVRKNHKNPSFSSSLLDEIYREIDGGDERPKEFKLPKEKNVKKNGSSNNGGGPGGGRSKGSSAVEDEEMASLRRACLIEKWIEKKVNEKVHGRRGSLPEFDPMQENDPMFFSSGSNSSDSSFGFSTSENESFGAIKSKNSSYFTAPRPKPVRTSVQSGKLAHSAQSREQSECYLVDDYHPQTNKTEEGLIKSKTRALKVYANLKKMKQPISPGGRLTSFINSLFTYGNPKKNKNSDHNGVGYVDRTTRSTQTSTCSSASSFSRSCLSKNSPNSREKRNNGVKRTVRFFPVSVIVDEDSRPCGHKSIYDEDFESFARPMLRQTNGDRPKLPVMEQKSYLNQKKKNFAAENVDDFEDDAASDSSSDLFELDHLALFKDDRFSEDLPVYETTHFGLNRAIATGLIR